MAVRDFKKFFKRRGRFVRQPQNDKKTFQRSRDDKNGKGDRKCFRCGDPNHLIGECPKPPKDKNQRDAEIQIILLESVLNHRKTRTKECSSKVLRVIAVKKMMRMSKTRRICLGVDLELGEWIKDNGCSKHMTGNRKFFLSYKAYNGGNVIFGSNIYGNIIGKGQICDNKCRVTFSEHDSEITKDGKVIGRAPSTPQSNGMVERKNRTLQEMSRTMLNEQSLPQKFWCNAVDTSTYILNRILIRAILGKTPYELLRGRKPTLGYFRVFGSKCFILNTKDYLTKFDLKSYEGVFLCYSQNSKAYIILNKHTRKVKESLNVTFDETPPLSKTSPMVYDDLDEEEAVKVTEKKNLENDVEDETLVIDEIVNIKESRNHPLENVIGNLNQRTLSWIAAMQEELNQFIANDIWELVPQPRNMTIIGTKWVFRNKLDENDIVSRNKARLVAQGYQQEGINYDENYALVARLESIRILLAYAYALDFKLFQMDIKSAFLNSFINEEVYVAQPPGFINFEKPDYKLKKALYCLKQAPKACLEESKPMKTPMSSDTKLTKDEECVENSKRLHTETQKPLTIEAVKRSSYTLKNYALGLWYPKGTNIETSDMPTLIKREIK
ncbi:retrovirus-related pol polyprotein from transposon TNT 1-94 [Tanacetum coccineum]